MRERAAQYCPGRSTGAVCGETGRPCLWTFLAVNLNASMKPTTSALSSRALSASFFRLVLLQKKIDEAEAKRQEYEQQRDALKTKIHSLNSIDMKVHMYVPT